MKRNHIARAGIMLLLGAAQLSWAGPTNESLSLTITTPGGLIQESNLTLHVKMTNRTEQSMTLIKSNPGCDFIAEVKDADGHSVPLTETGTELSRCKDGATIGRRIRVKLSPNESTEETYPIDLYYKLQRPGRYTVQLMREFPAPSKHEIRSNELILNLAE